MAERGPVKQVANNKKAFHDYFIEEKYECGIELFGTEVKSLRQGKCSIREAYVSIDHGEAFIEGMNISPYEHGNIMNKDPLRVRKLLLHKREIMKLAGQSALKGYTIMPLSVYFKNGRAKLEIGLARGKKLYDKREDRMKKDLSREAERDYKVNLKY
ncbi:MAG: SsrA-binding protein SmpB [Lachnospiraceae bacterium]|nr:SsrA-binding protein SmpB [Lachnospiraceae bacterium]